MKQKGIKQRWYSTKSVQYELVKAMAHREVVFMDSKENWKVTRGFRVGNVSFLNTLFEYTRFLDPDKNENIYVSLAKYSHIPFFTGKYKDRTEQFRAWFKDKGQDEIYELDFLLDFDSNNNFKRMSKEVAKCLEILDIHKVCYRVFPSGNNYQIVIDGSNFKEIDPDRHKRIANNIKDVFNFTTLDLKGQGDLRKIRKCEYSMANGVVCIPMKHRISNFNTYEQAFKPNVILDFYGSMSIYNRGLCLHNDNGKINNIKNFENFITKNWLDI